MRRAAIALCALLICGCSDNERGALNTQKAKYDFMAQNGASPSDLCAQAAKIAGIAADLHDKYEYKFWAPASRECGK